MKNDFSTPKGLLFGCILGVLAWLVIGLISFVILWLFDIIREIPGV